MLGKNPLKNRWKILFLFIVILPFIFVIIQNADGKPYTYQQKVNQGVIKEPKYTMCLRKKMVAFKNGLACIYQGAKQTFEIEFTDKQTGCPRKYKCVYNPNSKEPNINDVMKSLKDAVK